MFGFLKKEKVGGMFVSLVQDAKQGVFDIGSMSKQGVSDIGSLLNERKEQKIADKAFSDFVLYKKEPTQYEKQLIQKWKASKYRKPQEQQPAVVQQLAIDPFKVAEEPQEEEVIYQSLDHFSSKKRNKIDEHLNPSVVVANTKDGISIESQLHLLKKGSLEFIVGRDIETNTPIIADLDKQIHWGVFGTTGGGKTSAVLSFMNCWVSANTPQELQFAIIDLKDGDTFDIAEFNDSPYLFGDVVDEESDAIEFLKEIEEERKRRVLLKKKQKKRDGEMTFPALVVIIDEVGEILERPTAKKEEGIARNIIQKIVQKGRSTNVHLIMMGQTAYSSILGGQIKNNLNFIGFKSNTLTQNAVLGFKKFKCEELDGKGNGIMFREKQNKFEEIRIQSYLFDEKKEESWRWFKGSMFRE